MLRIKTRVARVGGPATSSSSSVNMFFLYGCRASLLCDCSETIAPKVLFNSVTKRTRLPPFHCFVPSPLHPVTHPTVLTTKDSNFPTGKHKNIHMKDRLYLVLGFLFSYSLDFSSFRENMIFFKFIYIGLYVISITVRITFLCTRNVTVYTRLE